MSGFSGMGMVVVCGLAGVRFALFFSRLPSMVLTNETLHPSEYRVLRGRN